MFEKMKLMSKVSILIIPLVCFFGYMFKSLLEKSWFLISINDNNFDTVSNFTVLEIPTTYYDLGQLDKILPKV
jgi:hypothetical protein